jgi:putative tricarboxylic transport membrane protein
MSQSETNTEATVGMENEEALADLRDNEVPNRFVDQLITLGFVAGALVFLYMSGDLSGIQGSNYDPGAAFWPRITLVIVLFGGMINLGIIFRNSRRENERISPDFNAVGVRMNNTITEMFRKNRQFYIAVVVVFLYLAGLTPVGFIFATPLFLFAFAWIAGYRYPGKLAVFSVLVTLLLFALFRTIFSISLPFGNGVFRGVSIFFETLFNAYAP